MRKHFLLQELWIKQIGLCVKIKLMNWFILAIIAFFGFGLTNFLFKVGERTGSSIAVVTLVLYLSGAILSFIWFWNNKQLDPALFQSKPVLIGVAASAFSILGSIAVQQAFRVGPASLISSIVALNGIIVVAASLLIFKEVITIKQFLGIVLALIAVVLITTK